MSPFDPVAATGTYMASLSPEAHAKATAYTHGSEWLRLWSWLVAKALVKTIVYRANAPSALEEFVFYDHPSVQRRVRRCIEWKAANPELAGKP